MSEDQKPGSRLPPGAAGRGGRPRRAKAAAAPRPGSPKPEAKAAAAPPGPPDQAPPADAAVPAFVTALQDGLPGAVEQVSYWVGDWTVIVPAGRLVEAATFLRDAPGCRFDYLSDLTAVDWPARRHAVRHRPVPVLDDAAPARCGSRCAWPTARPCRA